MNRTRSGRLSRLVLLTLLLTALLTTAYRLARATLIDFEEPPLGGEPRQIIDPYRFVTDAGVTFTVATPINPTEVVGLVKNNATSVCVEPADSDQKLGSGRSNFANGAIGYGTSALRATFTQPLSPPHVVAVDFQTGAGVPIRLRLFDIAGNEVAGIMDLAGPANGTCGLPGQMRARKRLTVRAEQTVAFAVMDLGSDTGRFVFTIDNFAFDPADDDDPPPAGAQPDLALSALAEPATMRAGERFTYTLTMTNLGPTTATQSVLTSTLSSGVTLLTTVSDQAVCSTTESQVATQVVCKLPTLPVNAGVQVQLLLVPHADRTDKSLTLSAVVATEQGQDPNPNNDRVNTQLAVKGGRVIAGLQALYTFTEVQPGIVHDVAGSGASLPLQIEKPAHVQPTVNGLLILTPTMLSSADAAHKLSQAVQSSGEVSVEAWIIPDTRTTALAVPVVELATGTSAANVALLQEPYGNQVAGLYTAQLVTSQSPTGNRLSAAPADNPARQRIHILYTRNAAGVARLYLNGIARATKAMGGDFALWDTQARLRLATDSTGVHFWLGEYQLVAFYNRALNATEVQQNYAVGPHGDGADEDDEEGNDDLFGFDYEVWVDPATPFAQTPVKLGAVIHRQGGKTVLTDVQVRFYQGDPAHQGKLIGDAMLERLSPRGSAISSDVTWTPPAAGLYTLYVQIDPANRIAEVDEANNLLIRPVTVHSGATTPDQDLTAPHVDAFAIDDNTGSTTSQDMVLAVTVSDPVPSAGIESVAFVEYEYAINAGAWQIATLSDWRSYRAPPVTYDWQLRPTPGLKYLQAWAKDKAGNISLFPYTRYVNYAPPSQTLGADAVHFRRYALQAGELFTVRLEPYQGDPDLYVWPPDSTAGRPPWVSNLRSGVDAVSFVAPVAGVYQVEIYGFTAAEYQLQVKTDPNVIATWVANQEDSASGNEGGIDPTKPRYSQPALNVTSGPATNQALLLFAAQGYQNFLPVIIQVP